MRAEGGEAVGGSGGSGTGGGRGGGDGVGPGIPQDRPNWVEGSNPPINRGASRSL